ncbi:MAG TPA: glycosyltransferase [Solirubrobacteraceae bacterium]|nr:glycosyltransferase [Solirubrobacteraceae bacterium]
MSDRSPSTSPSTRSLGDRVDVSVLVPVLNEERHIRETVAAMQAQRFEGTIELIYADGRSEDRTREILIELAERDPRIRVLDNPRRRTASALNVCLREARGEFVARMDAHTYYGNRYLAAGVERLRRGGTDWVSGPAIPRPTGLVSRATALALASWLGRGGSRKWDKEAQSGTERQLDTGVFGGVWRRATVIDVGGWDERWPINQDSEMAARFLARGARLVCLPEMVGHYMPRNSLHSLAYQYFRYGFYRARTFRRHPLSMRRSHLIAPAASACILASIGGPRKPRLAARASLGAYVLAVVATGVSSLARTQEPAESAMLVLVLPAMHLGWGFGTLVGVARFGVPLAALAHTLGFSDEAAEAPEQAAVYAPSLYDRPPTACV